MLYENEYWLVRRDPQDSFAMARNCLLDDTGNPVPHDAPTPPRLFAVVGRGRLTDYLLVVDFLASLFLSDRAAKIFRSEARCCPSISWVPVDVLNRKKVRVADYWLPYRPAGHCVFDDVRSRYTYYKGMKIVNKVDYWVLEGRRIPECDLFYSSSYEWFATRTIVELVKEHGLTGFRFEPVAVWCEGDAVPPSRTIQRATGIASAAPIHVSPPIIAANASPPRRGIQDALGRPLSGNVPGSETARPDYELWTERLQDVARRLRPIAEDEVTLTIAPPANSDEVAAVESMIGRRLPEDLGRFFLTCGSKVHLDWSLDTDALSEPLPEELEEVTFGQ